MAAVLLALGILADKHNPVIEAGHEDPDYLFEGQYWHWFFSTFPPDDRFVTVAYCPFIVPFGLDDSFLVARNDWKYTHGYSIDFPLESGCGNSETALKIYGLNEEETNEGCGGDPPPGYIRFGCMVQVTEGFNINCCPTLTRAKIYIHATYVDAFFPESVKWHLAVHEMGHTMGLAHHSGCGYAMSPSRLSPPPNPVYCYDLVDLDDVCTPRSRYGYGGC